jgi:Flp pilus assembly protein TadB
VATAEGDKTQFLRLTDSALCYGLSFGIYKKSRVSAILLFLYCIVLIGMGFILPINAVAFLIFVLAFVVARGILGTIRYHKLAAIKTDLPMPLDNKLE